MRNVLSEYFSQVTGSKETLGNQKKTWICQLRKSFSLENFAVT